jgi:3'-phosphoadenosine 5'-phosphosulfate sulfotransferase (PAPS reductase)/FAD synthetase
MDYNLQKLEKKSLDIIREAKDKFKNLAALNTGSKESVVCLYLCKRAFFGKNPFPVFDDSAEEIKKLEALIVPDKDLNCVDSCLKVYPFSDWSESDICLYIKENNILVGENMKEDIGKLVGQPPAKENGERKEKEEIMRRLKDLGYM